jgi:hypothetical protein
VCHKLGTNKVLSKTAVQVLYKKDYQETLSVKRTTPYSRVPSPRHRSSLIAYLYLNENKLDDKHNLEVLV